MADRHIVAALAAFALALGADASAARADHATVETSGLIEWPAVGDWQTMLMRLPNGEPTCIFGPKVRSVDAATKFGFTIWVQPTSTHLWLTYAGPRPPNPKALVFYGDGKPFASLAVLQRQDGSAPGWTAFMADIPGDALFKEIIPRLGSARSVALEAGDRRYAVPNDDFKTAAGYLFECGARFQAMAGRGPH